MQGDLGKERRTHLTPVRSVPAPGLVGPPKDLHAPLPRARQQEAQRRSQALAREAVLLAVGCDLLMGRAQVPEDLSQLKAWCIRNPQMP